MRFRLWLVLGTRPICMWICWRHLPTDESRRPESKSSWVDWPTIDGSPRMAHLSKTSWMGSLDRRIMGARFFDIMNFHYSIFPPTMGTLWRRHYRKATYLRQKLSEYGVDKPLVCTEAGNVEQFWLSATKRKAAMFPRSSPGAWPPTWSAPSGLRWRTTAIQ